MNTFGILASLTLGATALTSAAAQEPRSRSTREFIEAAAQSNEFEILEAQTALGQSRDMQVRTFAQQMIGDHERMRDILRQATARAGLKPPPMGISADQALLLGALQGQREPEFDKTYISHQVLSHRSALDQHEAYAASGDNPEVRQAAKGESPIIAAHLKMAERMKVGSDGS